MKFNKSQKDAMANVLDNIGTAVVVAMLLGMFIASDITVANGIAMSVFAGVCFGVAAVFRGED